MTGFAFVRDRKVARVLRSLDLPKYFQLMKYTAGSGWQAVRTLDPRFRFVVIHQLYPKFRVVVGSLRLARRQFAAWLLRKFALFRRLALLRRLPRGFRGACRAYWDDLCIGIRFWQSILVVVYAHLTKWIVFGRRTLVENIRVGFDSTDVRVSRPHEVFKMPISRQAKREIMRKPAHLELRSEDVSDFPWNWEAIDKGGKQYYRRKGDTEWRDRPVKRALPMSEYYRYY